MKMIIMMITSSLITLIPHLSSAADTARLFSRFQSEFSSGYESGKCQYNTRRFITRASDAGVDVRGAVFLTVNGYGEVWYYHGRGMIDKPPTKGAWFHHYLLLVPTDKSASTEFSFDRNYSVIDFDFGGKPVLVDARTYLREMFMHSSVRNDESKIAKEFDLGLLKLSVSNAAALVNKIDKHGELSHSAEVDASYFREMRFSEFFFKLPKLLQ